MPDLLYAQSSSCASSQNITWRRPTSVYCSQEDTLLDAPPLESLIRKAGLTTAGMIGLVATTPTLARVEQILSDPASSNRVIFVAVVDGCPTSHVLADFAFRAMSRQAMMVVAMHGNACMDPILHEATARASMAYRVPPNPGVTPTYAEQRGHLFHMTFPPTVATNDIVQGVLENYAAPWMADRIAPRGIMPASEQRWLAGAAGLGVGALVTSWIWKVVGKKRSAP